MGDNIKGGGFFNDFEALFMSANMEEEEEERMDGKYGSNNNRKISLPRKSSAATSLSDSPKTSNSMRKTSSKRDSMQNSRDEGMRGPPGGRKSSKGGKSGSR